MNKIRTLLNHKKALLAGTAVAVSVAAPSAFAVTAAETAITTAITQGEALLNLVAPGVITIAAIMLGVGLVVSWLRR